MTSPAAVFAKREILALMMISPSPFEAHLRATAFLKLKFSST